MGYVWDDTWLECCHLHFWFQQCHVDPFLNSYSPLKASLYIDIDRYRYVRKSQNPRSPLNFDLVQTLQEILILIWQKPCLLRKLSLSACSSLLIHYRQVGTAQNQITGRRKMNTQRGTARCVACRSKVRPFMLCK